MSVPTAHCEVKLHGFRRTQDGVVVSFVVHPAEVPKMLALDDLGTRYMLALAAIGDDEEPREPPAPQQEGSRPPDTAAFAPQANSGPGGAIQTAKKGKWTIKHGGGWEPGTRPSDPTLEPPEGAIHDDCPHDWYRDRCQICGARADTAAELGGANHQKDLARSLAGKQRYAESDDMEKAFIRSVTYPNKPEFQEWVARKVGFRVDEIKAADFIKWTIGTSRTDIQTDETVHRKFRDMEDEYKSDNGRLAERRG